MILDNITINERRWAALVARDASADGAFYYSVKTTGVYCRPSCAARLPKRDNVQFYASCGEAESAGFRPCKRCKPDLASAHAQNAAKIAEVCRLIEELEEPVNLDRLAEGAGLSTSHLHRLFKSVTGLTPKNYATAQQMNRVRKALASSASVTGAIYDAGFSSSSRFYESSNERFGMTPSNVRKGGVNTDIYFALGACSLGSILVAHSERGVCSILIGDDPDALVRDLQDLFPKAHLIGGDPHYEESVAKVVGLVDRPGAGLDLPLDIRGTVFQQRVWKALLQIPVGSAVSYAEVAKRLGVPRAIRAVAQACGANVLAVAIPCHRVIRSDGGLAGYRWGVERKRALLEREAAGALAPGK